MHYTGWSGARNKAMLGFNIIVNTPKIYAFAICKKQCILMACSSTKITFSDSLVNSAFLTQRALWSWDQWTQCKACTWPRPLSAVMSTTQYGTLLHTHCTLHTAHCTMNTENWTLNNEHWTINTEHWTLQTAHYILQTLNAKPLLQTIDCMLHPWH